MNLQTKMPTTADEFLRWNEGREGKREFVRGKVVEMMINTSRFHTVLALRLGAILLRSFPYPAFSVGSADFAVRTPEGIRFPDVFVDRGTSTSRGADLVASEPIFLAEILSPSSYGRDFVEKLSDYTGLPSLKHYLILSQDEPRVWLWSREDSGAWSSPVEIAGNEATILLADLDATISLAELYAGIES
jgi:Uma2 family endonuclease